MATWPMRSHTCRVAILITRIIFSWYESNCKYTENFTSVKNFPSNSSMHEARWGLLMAETHWYNTVQLCLSVHMLHIPYKIVPVPDCATVWYGDQWEGWEVISWMHGCRGHFLDEVISWSCSCDVCNLCMYTNNPNHTTDHTTFLFLSEDLWEWTPGGHQGYIRWEEVGSQRLHLRQRSIPTAHHYTPAEKQREGYPAIET